MFASAPTISTLTGASALAICEIRRRGAAGLGLTERNNNAAQAVKNFLDLRPVAFVGAGMSRPYYPGWKELLGDLSVGLGIPLNAALDPINQAEEFYRADTAAYSAQLVAKFGQIPLDCRPGLKELVKLNFAAFVTTNYCYSIYRAFRMAGGAEPVCMCYPELPVSYCQKSRHILFIHGAVQNGAIKNPDNFILHRSAYLKAYYQDGGIGPGPLTMFLFDMFNLHDVLFVGYGLGPDEPLRFALTAALTRLGRDKRRMMLTPAPFSDADRATYLRDWGIELVGYDPLNAEHHGLDEIVASISPEHVIAPPAFDSPFGDMNASNWKAP